MIEIDWKLALGIVVLLGSILLAAAKSIFVTRPKLYDDNGITIFMSRKECEKCMTEIKKLTSSIVPREEWEKSKAYRERRIDENQRVVCSKIDDITKSIKEMNKAHVKTNDSLNNMIGSFKTYLELKEHNGI